ncbi:uncharacterized protein LOC122312333 [Carya illinoinensis]|nr:uncharacterized protein LOC122312333 [Carya illinoinensis]
MDHWLRCNDIVITWLQNTMSVDIKSSTLYAETAHQLWKELEQRLAQQNAPRIYEVKQGIATIMQNQDTVSMYYSKLKTLLDELMNYESIPNCTCGGLKTIVDNHERDWVMKFLMGLNDTYKALKAQILLIKPFPSLNEVYSIIQQEEKRRQISVDTSVGDSMAMIATARDVGRQNITSQRKYYCTFCKMPGHSLERCFKANPEKPVCSHCRMPGHVAEKCFKLHGYPPGHKLHGKGRPAFANQVTTLMPPGHEQINNNQATLTQEQYSQLIALLKSQPSHSHTASLNQVHSLSHSESDMSKISGPFNLENDWNG